MTEAVRGAPGGRPCSRINGVIVASGRRWLGWTCRFVDVVPDAGLLPLTPSTTAGQVGHVRQRGVNSVGLLSHEEADRLLAALAEKSPRTPLPKPWQASESSTTKIFSPWRSSPGPCLWTAFRWSEKSRETGCPAGPREPDGKSGRWPMRSRLHPSIMANVDDCAGLSRLWAWLRRPWLVTWLIA